MNILLTGAFGNVGSSTLDILISREDRIRCFDIATKTNIKKARKYRKYQDKVEIFWGDLRNFDEVKQAVSGMDVVIHLGAIIPPLANQRPDLAEPVNVGGTRNIINAIKIQEQQPKLIYSSSVAIFGDVRDKGFDYLIASNDNFNPSPHDEYARQKIRCEKLIQESGITWVIFRFAAIPPIDLKVDPLMYEVPLDTPIEFCHTYDTGLAMANAVHSTEIWGKKFNIGGGSECRIPYSDYVGKLLEAMGIGILPEVAFGDAPFHCGYMNTTESQRLLDYQKHNFDDLVSETKKRLGFVRIFAIIFKPIVRKMLLSKSPHYKAHQKIIKNYLRSPSKKPIKKEKDSKDTKRLKTHPSKTGN
ncbi:MAG: NAD(P)-dependent oxidoreductase [Asgard group archaeon]|nr:NAD(P)-dependent oxidoreductase [Asgard group archaeon]